MYYSRIVFDHGMSSEDNTCRSLIPVKCGENVDIRVTNCSATEGGAGCSMVQILTDGRTAVPEGKTSSVCGECTVTRMSSTHYVAEVLNRRCSLCSLVSQSHCFLMLSSSIDAEHTEWAVVGVDSDAVHHLTESLRARGYQVTVVAGGPFVESMVLTAKEERCIRLAYKEGLFDVPRRSDLNSLCKIIGCSKSTLDVVIRTAERKLIARYVNDLLK